MKIVRARRLLQPQVASGAQQGPRLLPPLQRDDLRLRACRRDPGTTQDQAAHEVERIRRRGQDDFGEEDRQAHALQRFHDRDDDMDTHIGLVNHTELPQGVQVQAGVSLGDEELHSSHALEESEQPWLSEECPPELVEEEKERELTSMKDFGVYRRVPINQTTPEEQRTAIPTRWAETW
jgi:hypothetical protein